jgi:hypothetical protein
MFKRSSSLLLALRGKNLAAVLILVFAMAFVGSNTALANISGAIFTTLQDGSEVNANIFEAMEDVYLDGGPGQNAPSTAAGLPEGDYYFQVTDPSGKVLLSMDPVRCRKFHVNSFGVIDYVYPATRSQKVKGQMVVVDCTHAIGVDIDHSDLGAITVQLMPYLRTPNNGGVYKVWVTPVEMFIGNANLVDNPSYFHGFVPAWSKTDNYKVHHGKPCDPRLKVRKFDDSNADGIWDLNEAEITGWTVDITDPLQVTNGYNTPVDVLAMPVGMWTVKEQTPSNWLQTALYIDGISLTVVPTAQVEFAGNCTEVHEIIFGNIKLGSIKACKFYDSDRDGEKDADEQLLEGIRFVLDGTNVQAKTIHLEQTTGANGCVTFDGLLPGSYTLCEVLPSNWTATTETCQTVELGEGGNPSFSFGNVCTGTADFDTKGYWHNKNGLNETGPADFVYLNSLLPWRAPSSYFDDGDEPIDGMFADGTPVPKAKNAAGEIIAPEGSTLAEQSYFLVDRNAGGNPQEQLAQQLDAFIMNVQHRLDCGPDTMIQKPDGTWEEALVLIGQAITVWNSGSASERTTMSMLLDAINNSSAVVFIQCTPCDVTYPVVD